MYDGGFRTGNPEGCNDIAYVDDLAILVENKKLESVSGKEW